MFLDVTSPNAARCCRSVTGSAGMGLGTLHNFPIAAESGDISSSYDKTTASQVNIDRARIEVNLVLSLE